MRPITLKAAQLSFIGGTGVISAAQKFVVPVKQFQGEPLVKADGSAILDYQGNPVGRHGIVIPTYCDGVLEKVDGISSENGDKVVIANQVSFEQARQIHAFLTNPNGIPNNLTAWKEYLAYLRDKHGITDVYGSDRQFIAKHMTLVDPTLALLDGGQNFGFMKRDARDIWTAFYYSGAVDFTGTANRQHFPNGVVVVRSPDGKDIQGIQPDGFKETYRLADGTVITDVSTQIDLLSIPE